MEETLKFNGSLSCASDVLCDVKEKQQCLLADGCRYHAD